MKKLLVAAICAAAGAGASAQSSWQDAQRVSDDLQRISAHEEKERAAKRQADQVAQWKRAPQDDGTPLWPIGVVAAIGAGLLYVTFKKP